MSKKKVIDFQLDVEKYLDSMGKSVDDTLELYNSVQPEPLDIEEYFRQSDGRRTHVNSPSSLQCPKKLFYSRIGAPREQLIKPQGFLTMMTGYILGIMFSQLAVAIYGGEGEVTAKVPELGVYGHCDHLFLDEETGELVLLEFKTSAASVFEKPPDYYRMQTATYAHAIGADRAYLICFWMDKRKFRTIEVDIEKWWAESKRRFELSEKYVKLGIPPGEGPASTYFVCQSCPYKKVCQPKAQLIKGKNRGREK